MEKHFTIDRSLPGGDNDMSCLPDEMSRLVTGAVRIAAARGDGIKRPAKAEKPMRKAIRRTAVAARNIRTGERIDAGMIAFKRADGEVSPAEADRLIGKCAAVDVKADDPLTMPKVRSC